MASDPEKKASILGGTARGSINSSAAKRSANEETERLQAEIKRLRLENERMKKAVENPSEDAKRIEERKKAIHSMILKAQELDVCFLLDATASMGKYLEMVKTKVSAIAASIKTTYPCCRLRMSLVIYGDYNDPITEEEFLGCDFTTDFIGAESAFNRIIGSLRTYKPNGDSAEDVFSGLEWVSEIDWQATSRLLFHICDAPCHGTRFHDLPRLERYDRYPAGDKLGRSISQILNQLFEECEVTQYIFCHLNSSTEKMVREFRTILGKDCEDWIVEQHFQEVEEIPRSLVKVSCNMIHRSMITFACSDYRTRRGQDFMPKEVDESEPNWESIAVVSGQKYKHMWYFFDELLVKIRMKTPLRMRKMSALQMQIAKNPFSAMGCVRWPYRARILQSNQKTRDVVVKRFKQRSGDSSESMHSEERYLSQMEVQTVAAHMADEFNKRIEIGGLCGVKKVVFTLVSLLKVGPKFYNMEKYLEGQWIRYSNNAGYVNTENYAATLQAFTHWTHEHSGGLLMVTDLQGVVVTDANDEGGQPRETFWLFDPAIHCTDLMRFMETNLGEEGFKLFFDSHNCNSICLDLDLEPRNTHVDGNTDANGLGTSQAEEPEKKES